MYGHFFRNALQWQEAAMSAAQMSVAAGSVIQVRMVQLALGTMKPVEATRMMMEKPTAFMKAAEGSARALAANQGLAAATLAGLSPIRIAAEANAKRLSRRGGPKRKRR